MLYRYYTGSLSIKCPTKANYFEKKRNNIRISFIISGTMAAGNYMVKAICLEKATGTVSVDVVPAE